MRQRQSVINHVADEAPNITRVATQVIDNQTPWSDSLVGPVVYASRAEDPGFESRLRWDFLGIESYQWRKTWHSSGYPARWCYKVSAGTGWPGVSILWLGEMESLICNFYLSVAARKIVWADPSLRYTCMLLGL